MSAPRILTSLRPQLRLARSALPSASTRLTFSTSIRRLDNKGDSGRPQAAHPSKHAPRPVSSGEPVAEHVKEDESKRAGLPEEPIDGPPPRPKPYTEPPAPLAALPAHELFYLKNRTILITGGGRGLGLTIAHACLESGASVRCMDLLPEPSQPQWSKAEELAKSKGLEISYHPLDVTDQNAVSNLFSDLFKMDSKEHPIRGLFTSAGIQIMMPAVDYSTEKFRKVIDVDLTGTFLCAQAFAKEWFKRHPTMDGQAGVHGASIAMTGSMSGHIANLGIECAAYNASKAGVNQLAKNLALEWSRKGIRVNTLSPGYIRTALTAAQLDEKPELNKIWLQGSLLGRLSTPDEFRGPVLYLLSDASSFMTGADLLVDGGHCAT
ncbi:short-chain dehydrogenase [Kwoniella mangroviensis CBS 10435]|uniref:Short-chain dehydrogenase n=1 Tax=Kwoniella mangroviensis CBS 10435 TaxID=1331196 RepID=A0A1B9IWD9_9TREE|nr:short-chain dehydrogenase [Kwoniella mangroviensis CBS 8507]OCF59859.1 short-chain dehydrogenase [Kwoniella mangroviensis CBS 10435]OCF69765.1 short-chain dehydrogenase [Kwoniella mangroviensis CBS 8507]OCF71382.1 short-chain dehydrogenase [Kwoniella mangroviensis CBS 8886]